MYGSPSMCAYKMHAALYSHSTTYKVCSRCIRTTLYNEKAAHKASCISRGQRGGRTEERGRTEVNEAEVDGAEGAKGGSGGGQAEGEDAEERQTVTRLYGYERHKVLRKAGGREENVDEGGRRRVSDAGKRGARGVS